MKKLMMGLALGLMANTAWADGSESATEYGYTQEAACRHAKAVADLAANMQPGGKITGHSECDCEEDEDSQTRSRRWSCTVETNWEFKSYYK